jgi:hypothetical protein
MSLRFDAKVLDWKTIFLKLEQKFPTGVIGPKMEEELDLYEEEKNVQKIYGFDVELEAEKDLDGE